MQYVVSNSLHGGLGVQVLGKQQCRIRTDPAARMADILGEVVSGQTGKSGRDPGSVLHRITHHTPTGCTVGSRLAMSRRVPYRGR